MIRARAAELDDEEPQPRRRRRQPAAGAAGVAPVAPDRNPPQPPRGMHPYRRAVLSMYAQGRHSATDVCTLAFNLGDAAALVDVADLALDPVTSAGHRQGGRCARLVAQQSGMEAFQQTCLYWESIPVRNKRTGERVFRRHPFDLPHDAAHRLATSDPGALRTTDPGVLSLPKALQSEVFQAVGADGMVLCRLYIDGVPYQGRSRAAPDAVLVFFWSTIKGDPRLEPRRTITVIRRQDLCPCGCEGRCTVNAILTTIGWSFLALRAGVHPGARAN
jgi:hypothetical protein